MTPLSAAATAARPIRQLRVQSKKSWNEYFFIKLTRRRHYDESVSCCWLCRAAPTATNLSTLVILGALGGLFAIASIAVICVIIPRSSDAARAARPAVGSSRMVRAARPRQHGMRQFPSYGDGLVRSRPGAYVPRGGFPVERMTRVPTAHNGGFLPANQVSLYCIVSIGRC